MADIAHISGFVATGLMCSPFAYCDIVTTTTHKTLRGPRAGMIFCKKALEQKVKDAVFPGLQGGPHENQVAGIAAQMHEVATPAFREYLSTVRENARALATELVARGYSVITGGTDNHLFLLDLRPKGLTGAEAEKRLEAVGISVNKNTIPGDVSALRPSGIRIGTPAITTRGLRPDDMAHIAAFIDDAITNGPTEEIKLLIEGYIGKFPLP